MRFRNRARRKRPGGSGGAAPIQPPPLNLTMEIEQSVEARDKLEAGLAGLEEQREQSRLAFLVSLAASLQATEIAPNLLRERLAAWKAEETRAAENLDALRQFLTLFMERVEGFKKTSVPEVAVAIQKIITRLIAERGKPGADQKAINARIAKLSDELKPFQPTLPPPPREPKERQGPPERELKGKPSRGAATKN